MKSVNAISSNGVIKKFHIVITSMSKAKTYIVATIKARAKVKAKVRAKMERFIFSKKNFKFNFLLNLTVT
jgi:hypothetical protein